MQHYDISGFYPSFLVNKNHDNSSLFWAFGEKFIVFTEIYPMPNTVDHILKKNQLLILHLACNHQLNKQKLIARLSPRTGLNACARADLGCCDRFTFL
jgi:hypothetical protein